MRIPAPFFQRIRQTKVRSVCTAGYPELWGAAAASWSHACVSPTEKVQVVCFWTGYGFGQSEMVGVASGLRSLKPTAESLFLLADSVNSLWQYRLIKKKTVWAFIFHEIQLSTQRAHSSKLFLKQTQQKHRSVPSFDFFLLTYCKIAPHD